MTKIFELSNNKKKIERKLINLFNFFLCLKATQKRRVSNVKKYMLINSNM